ncbi:MAG: YtxH domain-containing protein [Chloroflexota bacterium]
MKKAISFLTGTLMGGLVGVTLALLLTPASGAELREQLQTRRQNFQTDIKAAVASRRAELEAQLAELRKPLPKTEI